MLSRLRTFSLPTVVLLAALVFSVFTAFRFPAIQRANVAALSTASSEQAATSTKRYHDATYLFAFDYPAGATIHTFSADGADTILVARSGQELEIQIAPTNAAVVSVQQIATELGASLLDIPAYARIAYNVPLVRARSRDSELGDLTQAWFIRKGFRYQLTATQAADRILDQVLATWCLQDEPLMPGPGGDCVPR